MTKTPLSLHGTYVTLVTPMYEGTFDSASMRKLMQQLEPDVDGFVPCASTGEGDAMSDAEWEEVIRAVRSTTAKPVFAGIKSTDVHQIARRALIAKEAGCNAILLPLPLGDTDAIVRYVKDICERTDIPVVLYNTESSTLTADTVIALQQFPSIIAIKDSSMNLSFFRELIRHKKSGELSIAIFQGMEYLLPQSVGCDGSMTALANINPDLCRKAVETSDAAIADEVRQAFWQLNLGGRWYATIKAVLFARGILRSGEELHPEIVPG